MGVQGLTTFLEHYRDKYHESVYLRRCPLVIDGNNLLYYLHYQQVKTISSIAKRDRGSRRTPKPHLYGGDHIGFAQRVREFFQRLKEAEITPIVVQDGAYGTKGKLRTTLKRFREHVREALVQNVNKETGKIPQLGSINYQPIFLSTIFLDVLKEEKILFLKAQFEADDTVAYIAKKLKCPIMSSDSDFYVYSGLTIIIPLNSFKFRSVQMKKTRNVQGKMVAPEKAFCLVGKYIDTKKLFKKEFNLDDDRFLSLVAAVLGNDQIPVHTFKNFYGHKPGITNKQKSIQNLLKWLGHQDSFESAVKVMLEHVKEAVRDRIADLLYSTVACYSGERGEKILWDLALQNAEIKRFSEFITAISPENEPEIDENSDGNSNDNNIYNSDIDNDFITAISAEIEPEIEEKVDENSDESSSDSDEETEPESDDENIQLIPTPNNRPEIPTWFMENYLSGQFNGYLLKILVNRAIFLYPQIEISYLPSSHNLSIPIIQVCAGILLNVDGVSTEFTLITRDKSQFIKVPVKSYTKLKGFGQLPSIYSMYSSVQSGLQFGLSVKDRKGILYEALKITTGEEIDFIEEFPPSLQIWIATLIYFGKNLDKSRSLFVSISVLLSICKAICLTRNNSEPATATTTDTTTQATDDFYNTEPESYTISQLFKQSTNKCAHLMDKFYQKYEGGHIQNSKSTNKRNQQVSWATVDSNNYEVLKVYDYLQYQCLLLHTSQLNTLLGTPLKPAKVHNSLNSTFVYKLTSKFVVDQVKILKIDENFEYFDLIKKIIPPIGYLKGILSTFINKVDWKKGPVKAPVSSKVSNKKDKRPVYTVDHITKGLNRFSILNDE